MLGFDTLYSNDCEDEILAQIASQEKRILLTKDRGLLKRTIVTYGYCVRSTHPRDKLIEVLRRFDLVGQVQAFSRCMRCNGILEDVAKTDIIDQLPAMVKEEHDVFRRCKSCGQVYWKGTHYEHMRQFLQGVLREFEEIGSSPNLEDSE
jgi:uncharacterized protein with PIN domain